MTSESKDRPLFGRDEAQALREAGWTQGSVFRPNTHIDLPAEHSGRDAWLVVCTQACSLVSGSIERDPFVELAVAVPVATYKARSDPATGKDVRRHHLPVDETFFPALEVDINARFQVPRQQLLLFSPDGPRTTAAARRALAGWLGRYYTRTALPDALVVRLRKALFGALETFLKGSPGGAAPKHHEGVHSIYLRWEPDTEIDNEASYVVDFLILCDEPTVSDALGARLQTIGLDPDNHVSLPGASVHCSVQARGETYMTELDGWTRLSEWDHLTGLGDTAEMPE